MLLRLRRYIDFSDRSRRRAYRVFVLGYVIVGAMFGALFGLFGGFDADGASSVATC